MPKLSQISIFLCILIIILLGIKLVLPSDNIFVSPKKITKVEGVILTPTKEKETKKEIIESPVTIIAVGDIMLSRNVASKIKKYNNPDYPFVKLKDILKSSDFNFANLESPIIEGREITTGEMIFRADPGLEKILKENNFLVLSLANNHIPNFSDKGIKNTIELLKTQNIKYSGAGKDEMEAYAPAKVEKNGIGFAFLSYNDSDVVPINYKAGANSYGTAFMNIEKLKNAIETSRANSDFVIVSMHSGTEYVNNPNARQIEFAHSAIDNGADLVIGHHPHVVQSMEKYKGKYIFYSLGNFVFDQMWSQETKEGLMIKFVVSKDKAIKFSLIPIIIENYSQPRLANEVESRKIIKRLNYNIEEDENILK